VIGVPTAQDVLVVPAGILPTCDLVESNPGEFPRSEPTLVEAAKTLSVRDLRGVVAY
jgi:hypothetical protein